MPASPIGFVADLVLLCLIALVAPGDAFGIEQQFIPRRTQGNLPFRTIESTRIAAWFLKKTVLWPAPQLICGRGLYPFG